MYLSGNVTAILNRISKFLRLIFFGDMIITEVIISEITNESKEKY